MMEITNRVEAKSFALSAAILLHSREQDQGRNYSQPGQRCFATVHGVRDDAKGGKVIGEGALLTHAALNELVEELAPERGLTFLAPEVLASCGTGLVWWRPPAPAKVWFNSADSLGQRSGVVSQPGLVFAASATGWWVWAVKGDARPTPTTVLHQSPYYNVSADGLICTGNADIPSTLEVGSISAFERAFWSSRFTHPNVLDKKRLCRWPGGAEKLWDALLAGRRRRFPEQSLVELKLDVQAAISMVAGRKAKR